MKTICIDPGHGGIQPGAAYGGRLEKDATLSISMRLRDKLEESGYRVIMTRETDIDVSLKRRCEISNGAGADAFVSIHLNSSTNPTAHGAETWKWERAKGALAEAVQTALIAASGFKDRGVKSTTAFYVLRHTVAPALVVECGFLSNESERGRLFDEAMQDKIAAGIARGIARLIN